VQHILNLSNGTGDNLQRIKKHIALALTISAIAALGFSFQTAAVPAEYISGEYPSISASNTLNSAVPSDSDGLRKPTVIEDDFRYCPGIPLSPDLQKFTYRMCKRYNVDYSLVLAMMWRESRFQIHAANYNNNGTTDSGIMQINDVNKGWLAGEHGITNLFDPKQNISAGIIMLSELVEKYGEQKALMAYQYGETGMKRKLAQGITTNRNIAILQEKRAEFTAILENIR
jgi:soluble lytic murein transglycosylase-like protein